MGKKYSRVRAHIRVHCSCDDGDVEDDVTEKTTEIKVQEVKDKIKLTWW